MDILVPPPRTKNGNDSIIVMKHPYSKTTGEIPRSKKTATHEVIVFLDHWIVSYGVSDHLLTENVFKLVSNLLATLCWFLKL